MTDTISDIRTVLVVDAGPVAYAAATLVEQSTLDEHVNLIRGQATTTIAMNGDIPYDYWGSGTQALWRLLSAMAYVGETVSLYEVVSRLDSRNRAAVSLALCALCRDAA